MALLMPVTVSISKSPLGKVTSQQQRLRISDVQSSKDVWSKLAGKILRLI